MTIRGLIVAATLLTTVGPVGAQDQLKPAAPVATPQPYGRFQIVTSQFSERSTFLIDTETGTVWQLQGSTFLVGEPLIWNIIPRIDNDDDMARLVAKYGKKSAAKPTQPALSAPMPR